MTLREKQHFVLGHRLSKHKMIRHSKNLGVSASPGYTYGCGLPHCLTRADEKRMSVTWPLFCQRCQVFRTNRSSRNYSQTTWPPDFKSDQRLPSQAPIVTPLSEFHEGVTLLSVNSPPNLTVLTLWKTWEQLRRTWSSSPNCSLQITHGFRKSSRFVEATFISFHSSSDKSLRWSSLLGYSPNFCAKIISKPSAGLFARFTTAAVLNAFKPAPRREGKIIFAPLAPFDVLFFRLSEKFAQICFHPKKSLLASPIENRCTTKMHYKAALWFIALPVALASYTF